MSEILMKHLPLLVFAIGLLIEVAAFFVGYADCVPVIYKVISPSYSLAINGLDKLREKKVLEPQYRGFIKISELFKNVASKQNKPEIVEKIEVTQFVKKGAMLAFSTERAKEVIKVEVKLSNGQSVEWDLNEIERMVANMKSSYTFWWAMAVFLVGVILQIIGFKIGTK